MKHPFAVTVLVAGIGLAMSSAAQAALIELSVQGIVAQGKDEAGLFSSPGGATIVGKPYTMSLTLDTAALSEWRSSTIHGAGNAGAPVDFRGRLTVGGRSWDWTFDPSSSAAMMLGPGDSATMEGSGSPGWNRTVAASIGIYPSGHAQPYFTGLDFEQRIVFDDFVDPNGYSASFRLVDTTPRAPDDNGATTRETHILGTGTQALWRVLSPVPEPARGGMLLAGAVVLGCARLRRRGG